MKREELIQILVEWKRYRSEIMHMLYSDDRRKAKEYFSETTQSEIEEGHRWLNFWCAGDVIDYFSDRLPETI